MTDRIPLVLLPGSPNTVQELPTGDALDSSALPADVLTETGTQTASNKTLVAPKVDSLFNGTSPDAVIALSGISSAVNHLQVQNNIAGQAPRLISTGTDANIHLALQTKGTGKVQARYGGVLHEVVDVDTGQILSNKELTAPVIADFTAANHNHRGTSGGGYLTSTAFQVGSGVARSLKVATDPSTAIANTTTLSFFDNFLYTAAPNDYLGTVGAALRVDFSGKFSTTGSPTLRLTLKLAGIGFLFDSGAKTCPAGVTDELFGGTFLLVTRTIGAGGVLTCALPVSLTLGANTYRFTQTTLACDFVALGAIATDLNMQAQWGAASASNTITLQTVVMVALN